MSQVTSWTDWEDEADLGTDTVAEKVVSRSVGWLFRLWCLPALLLVWGMAWASLGLIRGIGWLAGSHQAAPRLGSRAVHPGTVKPSYLAGMNDRIAV